MNRSVAIMGCGWLGLPLAITFIEQGYKVYGTTTSEDKINDLEKVGIVPYTIKLSENGLEGPIGEVLENTEILIINIPPKLRGANAENYVHKMKYLKTAIESSKIKKIIFISSTSVYGEDQGKITEYTPPYPTTEAGAQLLVSEYLFRRIPGIVTTIIRFGGLIDKNRHPINMLSGKEGLRNGNYPVNLIHLNDCIGIITSIVNKQWWGETFNAAYPLHPPKKEYYQQIADQKGLISPKYDQNSSFSGKIIDSSRLILVKKYVFLTSIYN